MDFSKRRILLVSVSFVFALIILCILLVTSSGSISPNNIWTGPDTPDVPNIPPGPNTPSYSSTTEESSSSDTTTFGSKTIVRPEPPSLNIKILAFGLMVGVAVCLVGALIYTLSITPEEPKPVPIPEPEPVIEIEEEEEDQGSMNFWSMFKIVLLFITVFIAVVLSALFVNLLSKLKRRADTVALIRFYESLIPKIWFTINEDDEDPSFETGSEKVILPLRLEFKGEEESLGLEEAEALLQRWRVYFATEHGTILEDLRNRIRSGGPVRVCMRASQRNVHVPNRRTQLTVIEWTFDEFGCSDTLISTEFLAPVGDRNDPEKCALYVTIMSLVSLQAKIMKPNSKSSVKQEDSDQITEDDFINLHL